MIICICHRVSDRELVRHAGEGKSFDDIQMETGVSTRCGQCEGCARDVVARGCASADQMAFDGRRSLNRFATANIRSPEWKPSQHSALA